MASGFILSVWACKRRLGAGQNGGAQLVGRSRGKSNAILGFV